MPKLSIDQAFQLAIQHHQAGRLPQAENIYRQILSQQPQHAKALQYLGMIAHQVGKNEIAVDLIRQAIALQPDYADAYGNLGIVLKELGQLDEAIAAHRQALAIQPHYADAQYNLGIALKEKGQLDEAIAAYRRAIVLKPNDPDAYNNLGTALGDIGHLDEAVAAFVQATSLKPRYPQAHYNLAMVLSRQGKLDQAIAAYRQAILFKPDFVEAYSNLGNALQDVGQVEESIILYRQAITLKPDSVQAHSNLIFSAHFRLDHNAQAIANEEHRWNTQHAEPLKQFIKPHLNDRTPDRRLKIGYVSPDFLDHPVGRFLLPLLANHDKSQVEVFAYASMATTDAMTQRLRSNIDGWRNIVGLSVADAADLIRQDQIDILVDLALHTTGNRLQVFARKPAPVQVTWLGYPGSTGLQAIDYRLTDPFLDPPGMDESIYSESIIRLPDCFWCYDPLNGCNLPVSPLPAQTNGVVTFGCLSKFAKITPPILSLWAKIMRQVKNSRLLLLANPGNHTQRTMDQLRQEEIDPARLEFIPRRSHKEYLQQFHRIDLALDTLPYNGHTTSIDGLWMGVPMITLRGQTAVGRAGVSILSNIGLPDLIAHSEEDYVRLAVELAHDLPRLNNLRSTLRARMEKSPLMDAPRFARNIESAYRQMWHEWTKSPSHSD